MVGRPPPVQVPQPFAPMERLAEAPRIPPPAPVPAAARQEHTAVLPAAGPSTASTAAPPPLAFGMTLPLAAPAPTRAAPSAPPLFGAYPSMPPEAQPPFGPGSASTASPPGAVPPVLVDVTPRGLVVETAGGYTDTIIPRNSKIPCERTRRFATSRDMQTTVRVRVGQGEGTMFGQNTYLGEVELSGLRAAARGAVTVAVTFEVDADGTLQVRAKDIGTGQEARAVLQLVGVADESSIVMMINRFAQQPVAGGPT
jgi:molecular chaperone DnaK